MNIIEKITLKLRNKIIVDKGNKLEFSENIKLRNCKIKIRGKNNSLYIEKNCNLNGVNIEIRGENCKISIGENTIIGKNTYISARERNISVSIGKDCMLSRNIKLMTSDGHSILLNGKRVNLAKSILIGNKVWIADNVTILKGVNISDESVIGLNSTVIKSFEEKNIIIGGYPAKKLKENIEWKDEII